MNIKKTSKNFGLIIGTIILIYSFVPLLFLEKMNVFAFVISILIYIISIIFPTLLILPTRLWIKLGNALGYIISPIVMGIIFYFTVFPTNLVLKLFNKNLLELQYNKSLKSYWYKKEKTLSSMKNQF